MRLVGGVDMVALVDGLYIEDFAVLDSELAVADDVLNLEASGEKALPHTCLSEQAANAVHGEQSLCSGLGASYDKLTRREEQDSAIRSDQTESDGRELASVKGRETEDLLQTIQLQRRGGFNLCCGHNIMDERGGFLHGMGQLRARRPIRSMLSLLFTKSSVYMLLVLIILLAVTLLVAKGLVGDNPYAQQTTLMVLWTPVTLAWLFSSVRGLTREPVSRARDDIT